MRKVTLWAGIVGISIALNFTAQGSWVSVGAGQDPQLQVVKADEQRVRLTLDFPGFEASAQDWSDQPVLSQPNRTYERFSFKEAGSWGTLGGPELPVIRKLILLPERTGWRFEIVGADYVEIAGHVPCRFRRSRWRRWMNRPPSISLR